MQRGGLVASLRPCRPGVHPLEVSRRAPHRRSPRAPALRSATPAPRAHFCPTMLRRDVPWPRCPRAGSKLGVLHELAPAPRGNPLETNDRGRSLEVRLARRAASRFSRISVPTKRTTTLPLLAMTSATKNVNFKVPERAMPWSGRRPATPTPGGPANAPTFFPLFLCDR